MNDLISSIIYAGLSHPESESFFKFGKFSSKEVLYELFKCHQLRGEALLSYFITDEEALELMKDPEFVNFVSTHLDIGFLIELEDELFYYYVHPHAGQDEQIRWDSVSKDYFKVLDFCRSLDISKELQYQQIESRFVKMWDHTPYRLEMSEGTFEGNLQFFSQARYFQGFLDCCYNQFDFSEDNIKYLWKQQEEIGKSKETLSYIKTLGKRYYNRYVNHLLDIGYMSNTEGILFNIK